METRAREPDVMTPAGHAPETFGGIEAMIESDLPTELKKSARDLLHAVGCKVAVAEYFDAFCSLAFSKPEWAAVSSPLIAEIFDQDEDQLAEMARIPDLVIELGSGQATVTCMVASRWAARGETHRLSRLAESIVASHASKNTCAVEVMLALAATLAVTRFSRAEQLHNAALPLAGEEHQEVLADARRWLAAGRVVCSLSQEERDFWDVRLRKPRTAWSWQGKEERQALDNLAERLSSGMEGADLFKAVVPACWWDLAMKCALQQEKISGLLKAKPALSVRPAVHPLARPPEPLAEKLWSEKPDPGVQRLSRSGRERGLFLLGWFCGILAMAITLAFLPAPLVQQVLARINPAAWPEVAQKTSIKEVGKAKSPAEKAEWRQDNLRRMSADMKPYAALKQSAHDGSWSGNEKVLSGLSEELPHSSPQYMKFLVWLHLDPPKDKEVRIRVAKLLLERVKADAITLWEELSYPGSANAEDIRNAAQQVLSDASFHWSTDEKGRLQAIAAAKNESQGASATVSK